MKSPIALLFPLAALLLLIWAAVDPVSFFAIAFIAALGAGSRGPGTVRKGRNGYYTSH